MTGPEAHAIVDQLRLPPGWDIRAKVMRRYPLRDDIAFVVYHQAMPVKGWHGVTEPDKRLAELVLWVKEQAQPLVVTTDAEGFITSIEVEGA